MTDNQKNHIGNALIFMCRYSFGRRTSADFASNSALKALWDIVPNAQRKIILNEIKSEIEFIDEDWLWRDFLEWEKNG